MKPCHDSPMTWRDIVLRYHVVAKVTYMHDRHGMGKPRRTESFKKGSLYLGEQDLAHTIHQLISMHLMSGSRHGTRWSWRRSPFESR